MGLDEDDGYTLSQYGKLLIELKRPEEAIKHLKKAISVMPDYSFAYYNLAKAYQEIRDFPNAIYNLMFSLNYEPDDVYSANVLGRMFLEVGLNDRALKTFEEILQHDQNDKFAYLGKAEAYFALEQPDKANQAITALKALPLFRSDKVVQEKLSQLLKKYSKE